MKTDRISSVGLLAGLLSGFLLAVLLGQQASRYSKPSNFVRFQQWTNPQTSFYPPFRMLEHLALARWRPGQTVVIVAGNSILNGVAQPVDEIWSRRLQERLGTDRFVVVNLSFAGAGPTEAGVLVAESLVRRGIPVVVVGNQGTGPTPDALGSIYGYYLWEARAQDALLPHPARDNWIGNFLAGLPESDRRKQRELERAARLNRYLYFQELWHEVGLHGLFTVWNNLTRDAFWRPRNEWPDPEVPPAPVGERFTRNLAGNLEITRGFSSLLGERDELGRWRMNARDRDEMRRKINVFFPPALRPHLLMVLCQNAPPYRRGLTADELRRDDVIWAESADTWREQGIRCVISGLDFEDRDYNDRTHLTASGGRKLADLVAAEIMHMDSPAAHQP